tara:strand:+ start:2193 stop:3134 length:942 start_codon:yes stop_codon:yes gene_type:complete
MMGENKTKNCKIVATYFGIRRHYPYDCDDTIETLKDSIKNEMEVDPGVDNLDIIFINHDCGVEKGNKFLQSIDGKKVFCGKIRVITRDWDEGKGTSLGSFDYAFQLLQDEYDYWFFQEDDYKLVKNNYYGNGVKMMKENPKIGFVGYDMGSTIYDVKHQEIWALRVAQVAFFIPILIWGYRKYLKRFNRIISDSIELIKRKKLYCAGGMMGLTTQKNLKMVLDKCGRLPHPKASNPQYKERFKHLPKTYKDYRMVLYYVKTFFYYNKYITWYFLYAILGEIEFTRIYYDLGLRIVSYPDYKQLIYSYKRKRFK